MWPELIGGLSPASIVNKIESGTNLVVGIDSKSLGPNYSLLANQLGLIQPTTTDSLVNHFTNQSIINPHLTTILDISNQSTINLTNSVPHKLNRSPLTIPVAYSSPQAYSSLESEPHLNLVSAIQLKNNQRIIWSGSLDWFKDYNSILNQPLTEWVTQQRGILEIESVTHSRVGENESLPLYKVNDKLRYSVKFKPGSFIPEDGQLEFTMLDPHLRIPLVRDPDEPNSIYATFNAPDKHGVFTLNFDYRRLPYSFISHQTTISIAPPRHDQFDRFIPGASPFYLGAASVALATISFIAIWSNL